MSSKSITVLLKKSEILKNVLEKRYGYSNKKVKSEKGP